MHGKYKIKAMLSDGDVIADYYGETHPLVGGALVMPNGKIYDVKSVHHMLKNERNGGGPVYITFDYVMLVVTEPDIY